MRKNQYMAIENNKIPLNITTKDMNYERNNNVCSVY